MVCQSAERTLLVTCCERGIIAQIIAPTMTILSILEGTVKLQRYTSDWKNFLLNTAQMVYIYIVLIKDS